MGGRVLVASGCSFTFEPWNWPTFVAEDMNCDLINVGMASQGNGLISKKTIYTVDKLLKTTDPKDIMVGIMWSGIDRDEFYVHDYPYVKGKRHPNNVDGWVENPTNIIDDENNKKWLITNVRWKIQLADLWYRHFHTDVGAMIQTVQNVLTTQWFLERNNIDYFMTTYMDIFNHHGADELVRHPEISYLYKMIDFDKFLGVKGCYEWVKQNYESEGIPSLDDEGNIGIHPTEYGHKKFATEVVVPHMKNNLLT